MEPTVLGDTMSAPVGSSRSLALVLGSGLLETAAAIPFLKNLPHPDLIVASGASAFIACAHVCGLNPLDLPITPSHINLYKQGLLSFVNFPFTEFSLESSVLQKQPFQRLLQRFFGERRLEDLPTPVWVQTTNILTGEGVLLRRGLIWEVVYASCVYPPMLPPIKLGGVWLSGGLFSDCLPTLPAVEAGKDVIVAVSFQNPAQQKPTFIGAFNNLLEKSAKHRAIYQSSLAIRRHHHELIIADVLFSEHVPNLDTRKLPFILQSGLSTYKTFEPLITKALQPHTQTL